MTDSPNSIDSSKAIDAALQKNWPLAIKLNKDIMSSTPNDIPTLNRLGFSYLMSGKPTLAKGMFSKVLKLDPYNRIATNNIKKIGACKHMHEQANTSAPVSPLLFLEEPGKTKIVECVNVASSSVLSGLSPGQEVVMKLKKFSIDIRDTSGVYIGALPDDLSFRLLRFIQAGNEYVVHIKHVAKSCVSLFIREVKKGKKFKSQISFSGMPSLISWNKNKKDIKPEKESDDESDDKEEKEPEEE